MLQGCVLYRVRYFRGAIDDNTNLTHQIEPGRYVLNTTFAKRSTAADLTGGGPSCSLARSMEPLTLPLKKRDGGLWATLGRSRERAARRYRYVFARRNKSENTQRLNNGVRSSTSPSWWCCHLEPLRARLGYLRDGIKGVRSQRGVV